MRTLKRALVTLVTGTVMFQFGGCGNGFFGRPAVNSAIIGGSLDFVTGETTNSLSALVPLSEITSILYSDPVLESVCAINGACDTGIFTAPGDYPYN